MKILICDTNEDVREYLRKSVVAAGYNPVLARDGEEALSILNFSNAVGAILGAANVPAADIVSLGHKIKEEKGEEFVVVVVGDQSLVPAQIIKRDSVDHAIKAPKPQALVAELQRHFQAIAEERGFNGADGASQPAPPSGDGGAPRPRKSAAAVRGKPVAAGARVIQEKQAPAARANVRPRKTPATDGGEDAPRAPQAPPRPPPQPQEPAKAAEEYEFPKDGSLLEHAPGMLLNRAVEEKLTGKLAFKKDTVVKSAFFKEGKLTFASSNVAAESIAGRLVEQGKITEDQHHDVNTLAESSGGVEAALMQLGLVQPAEIMDLIKETAQGVLVDVFEWRSGRFEFKEGEKPPPAAPPMSFSVIDLIKKGAELLDGERIKAFLGDRFQQKAMKNHTAMEHIDKLGLKPAEFRLTRMVNGLATGEEIVAEWSGGDAEKETRALQVLYILTQTKMVELAAPQRKIEIDSDAVEREQEEIQEKVEQLKHLIEGLKGKNYFEVLGVDRNAPLDECKKAFLKLARTYHPDKLPENAPDELREAQQRLFGIYSEANDTLTDERKRDEYIAELNAKDQVGDVEVNAVLEAEMAFQDGEIHLKKKDYKAALECFQKAYDLNDEEGEHLILLGWITYLDSGGKKVKEAQNLIKRGLKMRKDVDRGWMFLGHIEKKTGDLDKAEKYYLKTLQLNPNNAEAASEARLLQKRKQKGGGFFGRK